jgi:hypothetical protein
LIDPEVGWTWPVAPPAAAAFVVAESVDGALTAAPLVGAGEVTVASVLGAALGAALGDIDDGALLFGVVSVTPGLGATVDGAAALGAAAFELVSAFAAVSAIAPADSVTVVPLVDFFDVSLGVVCCAAAGTDSAASRTAASAYRCAMVGLSCVMFGGLPPRTTDSLTLTAQTMHARRRNVMFSRENSGP